MPFWSLQLQEDRPVFHADRDPRRPRSFLQRGIQHDYRVWTGVQPPQQALALLAACREDDLQSPPLAFDRSAVRQFQIHGLDISVHVVNADAALVAGVPGEFLQCGRVYVTQFGLHIALPSLWYSGTRPWHCERRECAPANYRSRRPGYSHPPPAAAPRPAPSIAALPPSA